MLRDVNVNHEVIRITLELNRNERNLLEKASKQEYINVVCVKKDGVTYSEVKDLINGGILFLDNNTNRLYLTELGKIYVENN